MPKLPSIDGSLRKSGGSLAAKSPQWAEQQPQQPPESPTKRLRHGHALGEAVAGAEELHASRTHEVEGTGSSYAGERMQVNLMHNAGSCI